MPCNLLEELRVDKGSPIPLYRQIVNKIEEMIESGRLKPHDRLPSETSLSKALGVSRMTVRKAFEELERLGWIYRKVSLGSFVSSGKIEQSPTLLIGFAKKMEMLGYKVITRVVSKRIIYPPKHIQKLLELGGKDNVYEIIRLRGVESDEKLVLQKTYMPVKLFPGLLEKNLTMSLTNVMRSYGFEILSYWAAIEPVIPTEEEARLLTVDPKKPLLLIRGITSALKGLPIRYTFSFYRPDRIEIVVKESLINLALREPYRKDH